MFKVFVFKIGFQIFEILGWKKNTKKQKMTGNTRMSYIKQWVLYSDINEFLFYFIPKGNTQR